MGRSKLRPQKKETAVSPVRREETVIGLIKKLDRLIAQTGGGDIGMAARILHHAKEDLVYWAASMNFRETARDRFVNERLYGGKRRSRSAPRR